MKSSKLQHDEKELIVGLLQEEITKHGPLAELAFLRKEIDRPRLKWHRKHKKYLEEVKAKLIRALNTSINEPHKEEPAASQKKGRMTVNPSMGFTILSGKQVLNIPGPICQEIASRPEIASYRRCCGDNGLSTEIVRCLCNEAGIEPHQPGYLKAIEKLLHNRNAKRRDSKAKA